MAVEFNGDYKRTAEYRFYPEDITINPQLNGRHDKPDIEWLITDILKRGQSTPVVIRKNGGNAELVAGFSRWRAVSEINKRELSTKMQLRCTYVQCNEAEAFLLNISENRFRNATTPIDDAHNIKRLLNIYNMTDDDVLGVYWPTAKTDAELKPARKWLKERIALISLSAEAADAVQAGRVEESAAVAIAKLSETQQNKILKDVEGTITRNDVTGPKPAKKPKVAPFDLELRQRLTAVFEDAGAEIENENEQFIYVNRTLLIRLRDYAVGLK